MKTHIPLRIPPEWVAELERLAKEAGHNRSSYIRLVIEKHLLSGKNCRTVKNTWGSRTPKK